MRANPSCSARSAVVAIAALLAAGTPGSADIGGGSGRIISPYKPGSVVTTQEVETVKRGAASAREIRSLPLANGESGVGGSRVGLMYLTGDQVSGKPAFEVRGVTETGATRTIDFSVLDTISVTKIENNLVATDRVQLQVKVFPTIGIEQLLSAKPTYTQLRHDHEETILLWVPLTNGTGELALVGQRFLLSDPYRVLAKVRELKTNTPVTIEWGLFRLDDRSWPSIWWATESVTKDPAYPHRAIARN